MAWVVLQNVFCLPIGMGENRQGGEGRGGGSKLETFQADSGAELVLTCQDAVEYIITHASSCLC